MGGIVCQIPDVLRAPLSMYVKMSNSGSPFDTCQIFGVARAPPRVKFSAFPGPPSCQILGVLGPFVSNFRRSPGPPVSNSQKKGRHFCRLTAGRQPHVNFSAVSGHRGVKFHKKRSSLLSFDDRPATLCQIFASRDDICQSVKVCQILTDLRTPTIPPLGCHVRGYDRPHEQGSLASWCW